MQLFATPDNPVPEGAFVSRFEGVGGVPIRYALWEPTGEPLKGTVCLFNGRGECIEKYFETVADLRKRGFAVATMDWRGQGGSGRMLPNRRKGFVEDFADFDRDLARFMLDIVLPDCPAPFFALAHSTGGNVLLRAAATRSVWFERLVLVSPLMRLPENLLSHGLVCRIAEILCFLGFGAAYAPGYGDTPADSIPFVRNVLTRDPLRLARNAAIYEHHPELAVGGPAVQWVHAACRSMREFADPDFPLRVNLPVLVIGGSGDRVVSTRPMERLAAELRVGTYLEIPGACHEILMERDIVRDQFWAAFDAFVPGTPAFGRSRG